MPKTGKVCVFYYYSSELHAAAAVDETVPFTAHSPKAKRRENMINKNGFKPYTSTTND